MTFLGKFPYFLLRRLNLTANHSEGVLALIQMGAAYTTISLAPPSENYYSIIRW